VLLGRRRRSSRAVILALTLGVLGLVVYGAGSAWAAVADLREARELLVQAQDQVHDLAFEDARRTLRLARGELASATRRLGVLPLRVAARLPYLGRSVRAADDLTAAASAAADGATIALRAADLLPAGERFSMKDGRLPAVDWAEVAALSTRAADAFDRAERFARRAPSRFVPGVIADARARLLDELDDATITARRLAAGASILPSMLGEQGATRHLIVVQNGAEARATGGAIEAVMLLEARARGLDLVRSDPDELALGTPRDRDRAHRLNLEPDFPAVAELIARTYRREVGIRPDTVIATDSDGLAAILRIVGGVTVDGHRLTGENLVTFLSRDIFVHYPTEEGQGIFLARTSAAMWGRLTRGDFEVRDMIAQLGSAARHKHFLLWSRDPEGQRAFARLGVSGSMPRAPRSGAVLAVVGNNAGLAELDLSARRAWSYDAALDEEGRAHERLSVTLRHDARRRDIPPAVLRKQPTGVLIRDESITSGGIRERVRLQVPPGERRTLHAEGTFDITPGEFRLRVFRQPGLHFDQVRIRIVLPDGARMLEASPALQLRGGTLTWTGRLERDLELLVKYR